MRDCAGCTACCEGNLKGSAYGHEFKPGKPCFFMKQGGCSIHETRPEACKRYQCAWSQDLFPDWMKPTESGVLVSIEVDDHKQQFLKVVLLREQISDDVPLFLNDWTTKRGTYYTVVVLPTIASPEKLAQAVHIQ